LRNAEELDLRLSKLGALSLSTSDSESPMGSNSSAFVASSVVGAISSLLLENLLVLRIALLF